MLDLDGTLLAPGLVVRPRVAQALRRAHALGTTLAVSSGRAISMVPASVRDLGVMDYYITSNGACVYDARLNRLLDASMDSETALGIVWALEPLGASWNALVEGRGTAELRNTTYMVASRAAGARRADVAARDDCRGVGTVGPQDVMGRRVRTLRRQLRGGMRLLLGANRLRHVLDIRPTLRRADRVEKLGCSFGSAQAAREARRLLADAGFEVAAMGGYELEVSAPGTTKGGAAAWLAARLDIPAERIVAFGDGANDVSLGATVGALVAMGNADPTLKAIAADVCGSVDEDGIATWLEAHMDTP